MCAPHLDPAEHAGIEDVHASVDLVRDKDLRFLNEAMDSTALCLEHHHAVLRGLLHSRYLQSVR